MDVLFFCPLSGDWIRTPEGVNEAPVGLQSRGLREPAGEASNPIAAIFANGRLRIQSSSSMWEKVSHAFDRIDLESDYLFF